MNHVVQYSGGVASWATAKRVVERHGTKDVTLLFADTKGHSTNPHDGEDADLYRFLHEGAANLGLEVTVLREGRTIWEVFFDERFLGNHRVDPCSKILKRQLLDKWHKENCAPDDSTVYLGYTWDEMHRVTRTQKRMLPFVATAPLCEPPEISKAQAFAWLAETGIKPPRLYGMGFSHNNCGGFCIKAGQAHFEKLWRTMPERYLYHEQKEQDIRAYLGKDVSILREQRYGKDRPLTMRDFRERLELSPSMFDQYDWGGCACMDPPDQIVDTSPKEGVS